MLGSFDPEILIPEVVPTHKKAIIAALYDRGEKPKSPSVDE